MPLEKKDPQKKVAIYCRVSTEEQSQGQYSSLESQEDIIKKFCDFKGWSVYDVYKDTATGAKLKRGELNRLLVDAEDKKFDVVAATKLDRISRSIKDFLNLDSKLNDLEIDIVIESQQIDTTTTMGKMLRNLLLVFAEFEREMISDRIRERNETMLRKGYHLGGLVPLGYKKNSDKRLEINNNEAKIVRKIFDYYLAEPSTQKVAQRLFNEGYNKPLRTTKNGETSGGGRYYKTTINKILRNVLYIGKRKLRDEIIDGKHEAIIEEIIFNKVQDRLDLSKIERYATVVGDNPHTLTGVLECGICGNRLTSSYAKPRGNKFYVYKCTNKIRKTSVGCNAKDLKMLDLDGFVVKIIQQLANDDQFFTAIFKKILHDASREETELQDQVNETRKNITIIKKELTNLTNYIAQGGQSSDSISEKIKNLENQKLMLIQSQDEVKNKLQKISKQVISEDELRDAYKTFLSAYDQVETEKKKRLNQLIFHKIISDWKSGEKDGVLTIKIKADGEIKDKWSELAKIQDFRSKLGNDWYTQEDSNLQPSDS